MAASMRNVPGGLSKLIFQIRVPNPKFSCAFSTETSIQPIEETEYPPIKPKLPPGKWSSDLPRKRIWQHYETGQDLLKKADIRERLEAIAGEKKIKMVEIISFDRAPRTLESKEFLTRTKVVKGLPNVYKDLNVEAEYKTLKPLLMDTLLLEREYYHHHVGRNMLRSHEESEHRCRRLISNLLDTILSVYSHNHNHLLNAQIDNNVRVETCWKVAGINVDSDPNYLNRSWMQYKGNRLKQIRTELPLPEFLPIDDNLCSVVELANIDYFPKTHGYRWLHDRPISVAGHWIGDPCDFTHLSVEAMGTFYKSFEEKFKNKPSLLADAWTQCGLISGFSTCVAQAYNLGFNIYADITYPITTQTVITADNYFQLFAYQLNTMHLWQTRDANSLNNLVWVGNKYKLFDKIENGKIQGFNDEAFINLLKFVLFEPVERGCDLRPYMADDQVAANKKAFVNVKGEEPIPHEKIGRFQYPRNAVYF